MSKSPPAFPQSEWAASLRSVKQLGDMQGLTKREYFAGLAMQGLASDEGNAWAPGRIAEVSVGYADALMAELAKGGE